MPAPITTQPTARGLDYSALFDGTDCIGIFLGRTLHGDTRYLIVDRATRRLVYAANIVSTDRVPQA